VNKGRKATRSQTDIQSKVRLARSPLQAGDVTQRLLAAASLSESVCETSTWSAPPRTIRLHHRPPPAQPHLLSSSTRTLTSGDSEGVGRLAAVLPQCTSLAHLHLGGNGIGAEGAGRLAAVLPACTSLAHPDLGGNGIGAEGAGRLRAQVQRQIH